MQYVTKFLPGKVICYTTCYIIVMLLCKTVETHCVVITLQQ